MLDCRYTDQLVADPRYWPPKVGQWASRGARNTKVQPEYTPWGQVPSLRPFRDDL